MGSIPGQGTRSHMQQLRVHILQLTILHVATKARRSQINKILKKKKKKQKKQKKKNKKKLAILELLWLVKSLSRVRLFETP